MATQTTPTSPVAWRPDVTAYVPGDVVPDALILQTSTLVGSIEGDAPAVRVPFVVDDGTAGFTAEGDPIADAAQAFSQTVIMTDKVAALGKYTYEALQQPEAARLIVDSLSRSVVKKANAAYLGNASNPAGLLNTAGITDGGAVGGNLDTLVDAVAGIEAEGGTASHIIAAPDAWAALQKLKTATGSAQNLLGAGTAAGERSILGVPVLVTPAMPDAGLLVIDNRSVLSAQSQIRLARSEDAFFANDVIAVRVTWRLGWAVMHPTRVAKLTTTP
ncbi:phage major capsid protein [Rhodococcus sp. Q]|uniref:phage major capsid protein n=1 Tax=Rhodococcus sp. Q TaxID=2502252 RepID=UPI0010F9C83B|nr:phage major capsid protein [Rhodococcus sp. Q]